MTTKKILGTLPAIGEFPGATVTAASNKGIDTYWMLHADFCHYCIGVEAHEMFISDWSSVYDGMMSPEDEASLPARVKETYGVDISDIKDGNFLRIYMKIEAYWEEIEGRSRQ